ncbi:MAG: hypothetical protein M0Z66_14495 [Thermaerobacter sp.]|nr:hypothetical protein [Thermaerobacter sp.]
MNILHSIAASLMGYPPVAASMGTLLVFVFVDVVLGVAAAVKKRRFELVRVADFVGGDLLKALVVLAFGVGAQSNAYLASVFYLTAAAVLTTLVGKINSNFKTVFGVNPHIPPPPTPGS